MKRLILLLLAAACGHEHPHDHVIPGVIDDLNTAYIKKTDPAVKGDSRVKYGNLLGNDYLETDYIRVFFSRPPHGLTVKDMPDPEGRPVIPLKEWTLSGPTLYLNAPCFEQKKAGGVVSVELKWSVKWSDGATGIAGAWLVFYCARTKD